MSEDLADRLGVSLGSTAQRSTYWFYVDQMAVQIGLFGIGVWMYLWAAFLYNGYRNLLRIPQKKSAEFQLSLGICLSLVGLFVVSFHYGPYRVGGIDLLQYLMWAFIATAQPAQESNLREVVAGKQFGPHAARRRLMSEV